MEWVHRKKKKTKPASATQYTSWFGEKPWSAGRKQGSGEANRRYTHPSGLGHGRSCKHQAKGYQLLQLRLSLQSHANSLLIIDAWEKWLGRLLTSQALHKV